MSGFVGQVWIGVMEAQLDELRELGETFDVQFEALDRIISRNPEFRIVVNRHAVYSRWTRRLDDDDWILTFDVRDSFIQVALSVAAFMHKTYGSCFCACVAEESFQR